MNNNLYINVSTCSLDSRQSSGLGRFVNREEQGNAYTKIVKYHGLPRICLFAKQDIDAGEEIIISWRDDIVSTSTE